jgi:branched-chain amino acid transport system permease protein
MRHVAPARRAQLKPLRRPQPADLPAMPRDWTGSRWLLVPAAGAACAAAGRLASTWLTLTVAGLAMGMIIFIIASGLTLVFGLMDVLNFGHGVFIALGAFVATTVLGGMGDWTASLRAVAQPAGGAARHAGGMAGGRRGRLAFERFIVRPVYGQHLKQILITMGGMIIGEELIKVIWGPQQIALPLPEGLRGACCSASGHREVPPGRRIVGLAVFALLAWTLLNRTKVGLLIRAGVQDREMVESLGYRIRACLSACSWPARRWPAWAA